MMNFITKFTRYCNDQFLIEKFPKTRLQGTISDVVTFSLQIIQMQSSTSLSFSSFVVHGFS